MKIQLKEEDAEQEKLRQEATRASLEAEGQRKFLLSEIQALQGRLDHLEFEAYRFEVVEKYHNDTLGKVEVALAWKAGFDYLMRQLPLELKPHPEWFKYPPCVNDCVNTLKEIEQRGGGLMLECENGDEDDEESVEGTGGGSGGDS